MTTRRAIIFIPGFKGSRLRDQHDHMTWPAALTSQFTRKSLAFNLPQLGIHNPLTLSPAGILDRVTLFPGLLKYDIYYSFLRKLESQLDANSSLIRFDYDWRRDIQSIANDLNQLILTKLDSGVERIDIIAHSMGGLIATQVLKALKIDCIGQIFYVVVPFLGTPKIIFDLMYGSRLGLNRTLLSSQAMATFSSVYALLPSYADAIVDGDIFDIHTWQQHDIGYLAQEHKTKHLVFLREKLQQAQELSSKHHDITDKTTQLINCTCEDFSTLHQLHFGYGLSGTPTKGDGAIPIISLKLPEPLKVLKHKTFSFHARHATCFLNAELQSYIINTLSKERF